MTITRQQKIDKSKQAITNTVFDINYAIEEEKSAFKYATEIPYESVIKEALKLNEDYCIVTMHNQVLVYTLETSASPRLHKYFLEINFQGKFLLKDSQSNWAGWHRSESTSLLDIHAAIQKCLKKFQGPYHFSQNTAASFTN